MTHPSHMTTDARRAYDCGDLDGLRMEYRKQREVCKEARLMKHVPYAKSHDFREIWEYVAHERQKEDAIFYGICDLMGVAPDAAEIDFAVLLGESK